MVGVGHVPLLEFVVAEAAHIQESTVGAHAQVCWKSAGLSDLLEFELAVGLRAEHVERVVESTVRESVLGTRFERPPHLEWGRSRFAHLEWLAVLEVPDDHLRAEIFYVHLREQLLVVAHWGEA